MEVLFGFLCASFGDGSTPSAKGIGLQRIRLDGHKAKSEFGIMLGITGTKEEEGTKIIRFVIRDALGEKEFDESIELEHRVPPRRLIGAYVLEFSVEVGFSQRGPQVLRTLIDGQLKHSITFDVI